jgi:hypothetical protein
MAWLLLPRPLFLDNGKGRAKTRAWEARRKNKNSTIKKNNFLMVK